MADSLAEVVVESVRVHMLSSQHVVLLKETERERYLPIWIGPWEANAIATRLQGVTPERPLTHDLFAATLEELGVKLQRVIVSSLAEETFHATLELERDGKTYAIDARPSDALALAVRTGARDAGRREARGLPRVRQLAGRRPGGRTPRRPGLRKPADRVAGGRQLGGSSTQPTESVS
jgi:bifunctional DNase/RNase